MAKIPKKAEKKKSSSDKSKTNMKMIAISIIIVMVFVSFAVIITTQEGTNLSRNMVFSQDNDEPGTYYGNYQDRTIDLSNVKMQITDSSAKSTNSTSDLKDGLILDTDGNFNCTFFDKNNNGKLDPQDEFFIQNADDGDTIRLFLKSSDSEIAFYTFSAPF
jgi:hypothetical protein